MNTLNKVLFISHKKKQCGVYQFGIDTFNALSKSISFSFIWEECDSLSEFEDILIKHKPAIVIYNYHPSTLHWITTKIAPKTYKSHIHNKKFIQIGIIHEITQSIADNATNYRKQIIFGNRNKLLNSLFDYYIAADPTLLLKSPFVFKTGRLLSEYDNKYNLPNIPTIGSYGFGTPNKGFEKIVAKVQEEFDDAIIRFNIPNADFGDANGANAKEISDNCFALIKKPGIKLEITHNFYNKTQLLDFLAQNSVNVFLYEDKIGRGISSAVDYALSVKRPIVVSDSIMFRHILMEQPIANISNTSISQILSIGFEPFNFLNSIWNESNLVWEYERILFNIIDKIQHPFKHKMGVIRTLLSYYKRFLTLPDKSFTWLRNTDSVSEDNQKIDNTINYTPITSNSVKFNRILDNNARELYKNTISKLYEIAPKTMAKKISEANVQQAFVFDTVYRLLKEYKNPRLLCVGSYEDTASMSLKKMGVKVQEIDPMINYFLQEFETKPDTSKSSYDIILSTSVIEHDPDDESFIKCIYNLLAPGGVIILTCDFNDSWKPGKLKPDVNARLYTQYDLRERLIKLMPDCTFLDEPNWNCDNPDFVFMNKYIYTFASFVVRKNR